VIIGFCIKDCTYGTPKLYKSHFVHSFMLCDYYNVKYCYVYYKHDNLKTDYNFAL